MTINRCMVEPVKSIVVREKFPLALRPEGIIQRYRASVSLSPKAGLRFAGTDALIHSPDGMAVISGLNITKVLSDAEWTEKMDRVRHDIGVHTRQGLQAAIGGFMSKLPESVQTMEKQGTREKGKRFFIRNINRMFPQRMLQESELPRVNKAVSHLIDRFVDRYKSYGENVISKLEDQQVLAKFREYFDEDMADIKLRTANYPNVIKENFIEGAKTEVLLYQLIENVIDPINDKLRRNDKPLDAKHYISFKLDGSLYKTKISCVSDQISEVLRNIINNAYEAQAADLQIEAMPGEKDGCVTIKVTDEGEGIRSDLLEIDSVSGRKKLFNKGVTSKQDQPGEHGIGLDTCFKFVTEHDGTIDASNRTDGQKGAEFVIRLPIV